MGKEVGGGWESHGEGWRSIFDHDAVCRGGQRLMEAAMAVTAVLCLLGMGLP